MKPTVYIIEDFRPDYENGVVSVHTSFEGAKRALIQILQGRIDSNKAELGYAKSDEDKIWTATLMVQIEADKQAIEIIRDQWEDVTYHCYDQFYLTQYVLED